MPGTELAFEQDVTCVHALGLLPSRRIAERVARFREINLQNPHDHHDALEFPSGQIVLVTRLCEGQLATVLQLPVDPDKEKTGEQTADTPETQTA